MKVLISLVLAGLSLHVGNSIPLGRRECLFSGQKKTPAAMEPMERLLCKYQSNDVDSAYLGKVELDAKVKALNNEIAFLRALYEQEPDEVKQAVSDTSVILSMDNNSYLNLNDIIAKVMAQYEDLANKGRAEAEDAYKNKLQQLQNAAGQQGDEIKNTKNEILQLNRQSQGLKAEIENVKKQIAAPELAIAETEERGERPVSEARAKLPELEAALQTQKQEMARQLSKYQQLVTVKLSLDVEIAIYRGLLEAV